MFSQDSAFSSCPGSGQQSRSFQVTQAMSCGTLRTPGRVSRYRVSRWCVRVEKTVWEKLTETQGGYYEFQVTEIITRFWGYDFGVFWVGKFGKYFLEERLDLRRDFGGIQNSLNIRCNALLSRPYSSTNKVKPNYILVSRVLLERL